jgi:hypothetical protein
MAGKKWSFRVMGETLLLVRPDDTGGQPTLRLSPVEAAWAIECIPVGVPYTDAVVKADLVRAIEAADGSVGRASFMTLEELRSAVASAIRDGRLVAYRTSRPMRVQREIEVEALGPSEDSTTWIEIMLIDEETKEPVPNERYIVETADGKKISGTTNASGKAREEGIAPGTCKVSWPDLPDTSWQAA